MLHFSPTASLALSAMATCICAHAQTVTLTNLTPVTAQATLSGQTQTNTLPAGPMPANGNLTATQQVTVGGTTALSSVSTTWDLAVTPQITRLDLSHTVVSTPAAGLTTSMSSSPADYVISISNPIAMLTELQISLFGYFPGPFNRIIEVDIDNDGSIEFSQSSYSNLGLPLTVGPQPREIRIRSEFSTSLPVFDSDTLTVSITPTGNLGIATVVDKCVQGSSLWLQGTFANQLATLVTHPTGFPRPTVLVIGFTSQPILLPVQSPFLPCILLPSIDLPVFLTSNTVEFDIPAAARPGAFWAQAVVLQEGLIRVTDGYRVSAF